MSSASAFWPRAPLLLAAVLSMGLADGREARRATMKSVVLVYTPMPDGKHAVTGSGVVVAPDYVLTNFHVVETEGPRSVIPPNVRGLKPAEVVWTLKDDDLALLHVPGLGLPAVPLAGQPVEASDPVWAIGYPGVSLLAQKEANDAFRPSITQGEVSQTYRRPWDTGQPPLDQIQHDAAVNEGNSGGPLVDGCGRVVGINTQIVNRNVASGTYFASAVSVSIAAIRAGSPNVQPTISSEACGQSPPPPPPPPAPNPGSSPQQDQAQASGQVPWVGLAGGAATLGAVSLGLFMLRGRRRPPPAPENLGGPDRLEHGGGRRERMVLTGRDPSIGVVRLSLSRAEARRRDGVVLGRSSELSDLVVASPEVSRRHLRIVERGGQLVAEDLNSKAGSTLDGRALKPFEAAPLKPGARLRLGPVELNLAED